MPSVLYYMQGIHLYMVMLHAGRTLVIGSDAPRPYTCTCVYGSGWLVGVMRHASVSCCPVPVVGFPRVHVKSL